jgi:transcriptional regulator with XRE-family HTH domain
VPLKEVFKQQLRRYRNDAHLTQRELSERVGKSKTYIQHLESGNRRPTMEMLPLIAEALGVPALALLSSGNYGVSPEIADILSNRPEIQDLVLVANELDANNLRHLIGISKSMKSTETPQEAS